MVVSVVVGRVMGSSVKLHPSPTTYKPHYNTVYSPKPHHAPIYSPKPTYAPVYSPKPTYTPKPSYTPPLYTPKPTYASTYAPHYTPTPKYAPPHPSPKPTYSPAPAYKPPHHHHHHDDYYYDDKPAHYDFGYGVSDNYHGTTFGHSEKRSGYRTEGQYFVDLPDGRRMVVTYYSDDTGYHPTITFEGTPTYPAHPLPYKPKPVHKPAYSPKPHAYKPLY
ncbi:adhesive plaque matrix protein-like isoform X2 [Portunus trituberculatus]|nr:adhesive plaque matrix protein-like isoform X2 [Portunus trituberculatus]